MAAAKRKPAARKTRPASASKPAPRARRPLPSPEPPSLPRRIGLALSGDWGSGAFLAGAIDQLRRSGRLGEVKVVAGSGSGALAAALVALGKWEELRTVFLELRPRTLLPPRFGWLPRGAARFLLSAATGARSLRVGEGIAALVHEHVDGEALRSAPVEAVFPAVDFHTGAVRPFSNRTDSAAELIPGLIAAASRPVLFPLVRVGFLQYAEGPSPLPALFGALRRQGAPEVDAVLSLSTGAPQGTGAVRDIAGAAERAIDLAQGRDSDERIAHLVNALLVLRESLGEKRFAAALDALDPAARAEAERHPGKLRVPVIRIHPDAPLGAGGLDGDPAMSRAAFAAGAAAAGHVL